MGLFGFNAEKKLAKGQDELRHEHYYEARLIFEEILGREGIEAGVRSQAKEGWRSARASLMGRQIGEAREMLGIGEVEQAAQACRTAIEIAADDLDASEARSLLSEIEGEGGAMGRAILRGLDADLQQRPALEDEEEGAAEQAPDEQIFEVYLNVLSDPVAERYRGFGEAFRTGYLALQEGEGSRAIDAFARAPASVSCEPFFQIELAQALLLIGENERALEIVSTMEPPPEIRRRRAEMRAILLGRAGEGGKAEEQARAIWEESKDAEAALLYGELLLENGKAEAAIEMLKPHSGQGTTQQDGELLLSRAYRDVGRRNEAMDLLEQALERFFHAPVGMSGAARFPLAAARDLLGLYISGGEAPEKVRSLAQHLIRQDPEQREAYKEALAEYARKMEETPPPDRPSE